MLLRLPYLAENVNVVVNTCNDWQQSVSTVGMFAILFGFPEFNDSGLVYGMQLSVCVANEVQSVIVCSWCTFR